MLFKVHLQYQYFSTIELLPLLHRHQWPVILATSLKFQGLEKVADYLWMRSYCLKSHKATCIFSHIQLLLFYSQARHGMVQYVIPLTLYLLWKPAIWYLLWPVQWLMKWLTGIKFILKIAASRLQFAVFCLFVKIDDSLSILTLSALMIGVKFRL